MIREARRAAGLTQLEVAQRAHTAQPAVAAYESGGRTPNMATLERLLRACDHDVEVLARARVRRGAASLAELATTIAHDLQGDRESDAVRLLFGFADDFRGSSRPGRIALIREGPPTTGDARFDAALAGLAELFAAEGAIPAPRGSMARAASSSRGGSLASRPAFHAYVLAHTPALLARHGVFMAREVFDRA